MPSTHCEISASYSSWLLPIQQASHLGGPLNRLAKCRVERKMPGWNLYWNDNPFIVSTVSISLPDVVGSGITRRQLLVLSNVNHRIISSRPQLPILGALRFPWAFLEESHWHGVCSLCKKCRNWFYLICWVHSRAQVFRDRNPFRSRNLLNFLIATKKCGPKQHLPRSVAICDRKHVNRISRPKVIV